MNGNKEKIGYKVVRVANKRGTVFKPATISALQRIRYRIGQWTERNNCGSFCLFETYQQAFAFWTLFPVDSEDIAILECKYIPTRKPDLRDEHRRKVFVWKKKSGQWRACGDFAVIRDYYNRKRQYVVARTSKLPIGTVLADKVFPIKVIRRF